jgi:hypothetical protein
MKTTLILILFNLLCMNAIAQAPQAFRYQAVARNSAGAVLANQKVSFRITIQQRIVNGIVVYAEQHTVTTNGFGLANLDVGKGTPLNGIFSQVKWGTDEFYIRVEMDPSGGTSYQDMGITQLLSVPYALYAKSVEMEADGDATNELQKLTISGTVLTLDKSGGSVTLPSGGTSGDNWGTQSVVTDATLTGNGTTATPLKIADNGITSAKIQDAGIVTADLADQTVSTAKLGNLAVSAEKIAGMAVTADKLANGAVTTDKINAGAVTGAKIAQAGATNGQVLKWNATTWAPANDETGGGGGLTLPFSGSAIVSENPVFEITNNATSSVNYGIKSTVMSVVGRAIWGRAQDESGSANNVGVFGESYGPVGQGVHGIAKKLTGKNYGVYGTSLSVDGIGVYGTSPKYGIYGSSSGDTGTGVYGYASGGSDINYGVYGESASTSGYGVYGKSGKYGVYGESLSTSGYGIYGKSNYKGVYGHSTATTGISTGVEGRSSSTQGTGVMGWATATTGINTGVHGETESSSGCGVYGNAPLYAILGEAASSAGRAVTGEATGTASIGVKGVATNTSSTGVWGEGSNQGVYGEAVTTTGENFGVYGKSKSSSGYGVAGVSPKYGTYGGSSGSQGRAVWGEASGISSIGVYGKALADNSTGVYGEGSKYDFYAAGPGTDYGTSSSIRWKKNLTAIPDPIGKIKAIRGVFFDWDEAHGGKHDVGMIAEEVGKVLPEIVDYEENGIDAIGLDYSKITPLLLEAIKAQQTEIELLKERVEKLEKLFGASALK